MAWRVPIDFKLIPSNDGNSFLFMPEGCTALPLAPHPGSYGFVRKEHVHEGIDLYCPEGTPVRAVEDGEIVACLPFTGPMAGSRWWLDTYAVLVEGQSGVVVYGEVMPCLTARKNVKAGDVIGTVAMVLAKDKGRPRSMLHLELHRAGTRDVYAWKRKQYALPESTRPPSLCDPTRFLLTASR